MAVGTVAAAAGLGARIYGRTAGLVAASVLAVLPLHTRFSHLAATDIPSALWTTLAVLWAVRVCQRGRSQDCVIAGVLVGLAAGTKYPGVLAAVPVATAALLSTRSVRQLGLAAGAALLTLAAVTPYLLLAPGEAWQDLAEMGTEHLLSDEHQTSDLAPVHFVGHTLYYGLGLGALLTIPVALLWKPAQLRREEIVLIAGIVALSLLPLVSRSGFMRYAVPVAPLLVVLIARPLTGLHLPRWAFWLWLAVVLAQPGFASVHTRSMLSGPDTRTQALEWIRRHEDRGYRLIVLPGRAGAPAFLTPGVMLAREAYFRRSYDEDRLRQAYSLLSRGTGYPPLGVIEYGSDQPIARAGEAPGIGLLCLCEHPLLGPGDGGVLQASRWPLDWVEFDSGDHERAVYDPVDWYFLPVSGFSAATATGPDLKLAWAGLPVDKPVPSAQEWFGFRHRILDAKHAVVQGRWQDADRLHSDIFDEPYIMPELLAQPLILELLTGAARTQSELGSPERALALWERCLSHGPDDPVVHTNIGNAMSKLGRHEPSLHHFRRAAQLAPKNADVLFNLGTTHLRLADYGEAARVLERAIAVRPDADSYSNFGWAYLLGERLDLAERSLARALEIHPGHTGASRGIDDLGRRRGLEGDLRPADPRP